MTDAPESKTESHGGEQPAGPAPQQGKPRARRTGLLILAGVVVIAAIVLSAVAATVPTAVMNRAASHRLRCRIST